MRICHFSDTHLGAGENHPRRGESGLTLRQEDIVNSFREVIDRIIKIQPDICIHSGDIFHGVRPLNRIMAIAGRELHRLAEKHAIPTVIITGNHDAPRQFHVGAALDVFRQIDNLHIVSGNRPEVIELESARICALPHCPTSGRQAEQLTNCLADPGAAFNIFVAHGVVAGMPEFSMADLGEQELPLDVINRFDYTALGHFHNFRRVGARAYYAGSSERLSQLERDVPKGFLEVELEPFSVSFQEVRSRAMVDVAGIDATGRRGDEIAEMIREELDRVDGTDKIVRVSVGGVTAETMKTMPSEVIADLKDKSFALDIRFEKAKDEASESKFGRSAIGRLDLGFIEFLETVPLEGFERERLKADAQKYLSSEE